MTTTGKRKIIKGGVAMLLLGAVVGITGLVSSPASAEGQVAICHRTSSITNPYRQISVDLAATHGPDHATHTGPVFDPAVNTQENKGDWGDIIPNVLNWDAAGQAIYNADCQLPGEPADPEVCAYDVDLDATDSGCVPPADPACAEDQVGVWPDCTTPEVIVPVCAEGQVGVWPDCTTPDPQPTGGDQTGEELGARVEGLVLVAQPAASTAPAATELAALPRTGTATVPLAQLGLGLVLLGAGALIVGREQRLITV